MKSPFAYLLGVTGVATLVFLSHPSPSQGDASNDPATLALVEELTVQQAKLIENQTTMDTKLAQIGEEVRQARLFVARGGGKK